MWKFLNQIETQFLKNLVWPKARVNQSIKGLFMIRKIKYNRLPIFVKGEPVPYIRREHPIKTRTEHTTLLK